MCTVLLGVGAGESSLCYTLVTEGLCVKPTTSRTGIHPFQVQALYGDTLENGEGGAQTILITNSPAVLDHLWFEDAADFQRKLILYDADTGTLRDPTPAEARSFMCAWDVGIQQVSEILAIQGLW
jgi:hypothetical protein